MPEIWENDSCPGEGCPGRLYQLPDTSVHRGYCIEHGELIWINGVWAQVSSHAPRTGGPMVFNGRHCRCYDCMTEAFLRVH